MVLIRSFRYNRKHHSRQSNASLSLKDCFFRQTQCADPEILSFLGTSLPKPPVRALNERIRDLLKVPNLPLSEKADSSDESSDSDDDESEFEFNSEDDSEGDSDME